MNTVITNNLNNSFINIEDTYIEEVYVIYKRCESGNKYIAYVYTLEQAELEMKFLGSNYFYVLEEKNI